MSKHTSGPWIIQSDPCHYDTLSIVNVGRKMIVHVGGCCEPAEQEANTRLIAAAPDLYAALETLVAQFGPTPSEDHVGLGEARAAIAKAKGEV